MIPFLDLKADYFVIKDEINAAITRQLESGIYILGETVDEFENLYSEYVGSKFCIGVGNGLDALTLSLTALGIGPGDEVIVPANTYIATWLAVTAVGANPVPVEPDLVTYCLDPLQIEKSISRRTRAIIPVHLYGHPVKIDEISEICKKYELKIIFDAAQSHGALYKDQQIGKFGNAVAWSFYPGKNLGAYGDAGAITTNDRDLADRLKKIRNYGSSKKYYNDYKGVNSRLDPIQACVLIVKLKYLAKYNQTRSKIASKYNDAFRALPLICPTESGEVLHCWHQYVIRTPLREALIRHLNGHGIQTLIHYPVPPYLQQAYRELGINGSDFPLSTKLADEVLSLPIDPRLEDAQVDEVIAKVQGFF